MDKKLTAVLCALLAAAFYAANIPLSKLLLARVDPAFMAAFLYLGAGVGVGLMSLCARSPERAERLSKRDFPYALGMVLLDIAAPILLMLGIRAGSASNVSLLANFEIVATALIALAFFRESVSGRLWGAVGLIALSGALLSFDGADGLRFSVGSLFALGAALCWGLENNCTSQISAKSAYEIVVLKGLFSGGGSFLIALATGERLPRFRDALSALALGFVAYGLSVFLYVRAQRGIGAAKTSAYYAFAPFIGVFLSFAFLREPLTPRFFAALCVMAAGTALAVLDTLSLRHTHAHTHTFSHFHDGAFHTHTVAHTHPHEHYAWTRGPHARRHSLGELERELAENRL